MNVRTVLFSFLFFLFVFQSAPAEGGGDTVKKPADWHSGVGVSDLPDSMAAGDTAAYEAKNGLAGVPAKFVMIVAAKALVNEALLDGVKNHFPADIIYGCEVTSPLTHAGNQADSKTLDVEKGVAVWALGGDVDITVASAHTDGDGDEEDVYYQAGTTLAGKLREAMETSKRPGKFLFTWGDQFTGSNKAFARGLNDGFGATYPIVGAAAGGAEAKVIFEGKIESGINGGAIIAGDFLIAMAKRTGPHTPKTAEQTLSEALKQGDGAEPFFGLVFNCRRRRIGMMNEKRLAEEHATILKFFPGKEFFGYYGPGEIGPSGIGEPSEGVGFSVVAALLFAL